MRQAGSASGHLRPATLAGVACIACVLTAFLKAGRGASHVGSTMHEYQSMFRNDSLRCHQNPWTGGIARPLCRFLTMLMCCTGFAACAAAQADAFDLQLEYRVSWGNVDVASARAAWRFGQSSFELSATSETLGLTDSLRRYRGRLAVSGKTENGRYAPATLFMSGVSKRRSRQAFTRWDPVTGAISTDRTPELDLEKVFPLKDRHVKGAIDPLSAMLNALASLAGTGSCGGSARLYDGLRTSEITAHDLGMTVLKKDRPFGFEGEARICGFTGTPTGGHQRKSRWRKDKRKPEDLQVFVAEVAPGLFLPVRMEANAFIGTVTSRLVMPALQLRGAESSD